uniref:uncharacterized protein LOC117611186 n=2 Tax=Osmia lignaria TaxID=473952 RepID=UPI0014793C7D|nr:uncharacterized protein LOC117611186 [Osmia lignaria]
MTASGPAAQENVLRQLLDRMQRMEEGINQQLTTLGEENQNRAKEIQNIAKQLKLVTLTEDASTISRITRRSGGDQDNQQEDEMHTARQPPQNSTIRPNELMKAVDAIRTIETLRGRDDVGVEDFIKSVRYARSNCSEKTLLLKLILIEKITENAKRSIRYTSIETYEELYEVLRQNVSIPNTVSSCRNKLQQIRQGAMETVQSYNLRFRQQLNELIYAVQNKHQNPISRRIAIEQEETEATRTYVLNLRRDIGMLVIPSKPKLLIEAQTMAADMELWTRDANRAMERRQVPSRIPPPKQQGQRPNTSSDRPNHSIPLKCTKCGRLGHTSDKCYARNFQVANQGKIPPPRVNNLNFQEDKVTETTSESTAPPENYYKFAAEFQECRESEDYSWTQEQESTSSSDQ